MAAVWLPPLFYTLETLRPTQTFHDSRENTQRNSTFQHNMVQGTRTAAEEKKNKSSGHHCMAVNAVVFVADVLLLLVFALTVGPAQQH